MLDAERRSDPFWENFAGLKSPNYTQIPNDILDKLMPRLSPTEFKIIMCLARLTLGWHVECAEASLSELSALSGLSRRTIQRAIIELESLGLIAVSRERLDAKSCAINIYALIIAEPENVDKCRS